MFDQVIWIVFLQFICLSSIRFLVVIFFWAVVWCRFVRVVLVALGPLAGWLLEIYISTLFFNILYFGYRNILKFCSFLVVWFSFHSPYKLVSLNIFLSEHFISLKAHSERLQKSLYL